MKAVPDGYELVNFILEPTMDDEELGFVPEWYAQILKRKRAW